MKNCGTQLKAEQRGVYSTKCLHWEKRIFSNQQSTLSFVKLI